ncbi:MAG: sulfite exporter TauE/SafE family protein [Eubacteriales bacterium]|nr:sulfite exporter TauE/SafE family protein [Eubacteriales bacterium]
MNILWYIAAGLAAGILSGMGMGGGTVLIPLLTLLLGVEQHAAQAANMLGFLPGALLAVCIHKKAGRLDWKTAKPLLITGVLGAAAGALLATVLSAEWLRRGFGLFLVVFSVLQYRRGEQQIAKKRQ